jgi:hypothetical protein
MNLIHKHITIENDTITLEELQRFRGKSVELIVFEESMPLKKELRGNVNKFLALAGKIEMNEQAFYQLRDDSML